MDERFYQSGQSSSDLKTNIRASLEDDNDLIVAESAEPRLNFELQDDFNLVPIKKDGSVSEWIKILQDYQFIVTSNSFNLMAELEGYVWSDRKAGIPVDANNHLLDAMRYFFMYQKQQIDTNVWL